MEIWGHYFELTLNLLAAPAVLSFIGTLLFFGIKRHIDMKEKRDDLKHAEVMTSIAKLDEKNTAEHTKIYNKWDNHERRISRIEGAHGMYERREGDNGGS